MLRMTSDPTEEAWTEAMQEAMERSQDTPMDRGTFHPVIMKMNASRRAETGIVSMDFVLARIAEERRFTLWDRTFNTLAPAAYQCRHCGTMTSTTPTRTEDDPGLDKAVIL